ncbi:MAG: hypothetical protein Kow0042_18130 [Calditrichia bacterium]
MKGTILILLVLPCFLLGQYWGERVTEKSFENSELYFTSYYLNTYGVLRFREVVVGLIDDPFLNLHLNPALAPRLQTNYLVYVDFRGDRTEVPVLRYYRIMPTYYRGPEIYPPISIDPRWYQQTRREPEPVLSLGILTYPFANRWKNLFVGATYQVIHKNEPYYSPPSWIYYPFYGYDAFGARLSEGSIPIEERYSGEDEMAIRGHLFSAFFGIQPLSKILLGFSLNAVSHTRDGSYLNLQNDEYGQSDRWEWSHRNERARGQEYDHTDVAGGFVYNFTPDFHAGLKLGYLSGKADQDYSSSNFHFYQYNFPEVSANWSYSRSLSHTRQKWEHDGHNWYGGIHLSHNIDPQKFVQLSYRYTKKQIDLVNATSIEDTSFYSGRWDWDTTYIRYQNNASLDDQRSGSGDREEFRHEGLLNLRWKLTGKSILNAGIYYVRKQSRINSLESVVSDRRSHYHTEGYHNYDHERQWYEKKVLDWRYDLREWSIRIPLLLTVDFNPSFSWMIGINRILNSWEIEDVTTAYFQIRKRVEDGEVKSEMNFGERYREPVRKLTEDYTDLITQFRVNVSPQFGIELLLDPELEENFRVAQWWLSFRANL